MPKDNQTGISPTDLRDMRKIMDDAAVARPRHCFRWNNTLERWELSEVAPANRTLLAYQTSAGWVTV